MKEALRNLGKETAVYGIATVLARLLSFLLLPLYTHFLSPVDFGVLATLLAYVAFLNVVYLRGMDLAYMRHPDDFSTPFWSVAASSLALSGLILLLARPLAAAAGLAPGSAGLVAAAAGILAFDAACGVPFSLLRIQHRAAAYSAVRTANIAINLLLNYVFLVRLGMGAWGVFLAYLIASASTFAMLAPVSAVNLRAVFSGVRHRELLSFSLPLLPASLSSMAVQVIDRPILAALTDDATVGLYQANYKLGVAMMLFVNMFDAAFKPFFLERRKDPLLDGLLAKVLTYFVLAGAFILLAVSFFIEAVAAFPLPGGRSLIHPAYWPGLGVVPVVLGGYLLNGIYYNFLAPATLARRTDLIAWAAFLGAGVNVGANLLWIPRWGIMGAAWATFAAYGAMAVALYFAGRRLRAVPYEWGRLALIAGCAALLFWIEPRVAGALGDWAWTGKLALLAAFPAALAAAGFLEAEEARSLWTVLRTRSAGGTGVDKDQPPA